MSEFSAVSASSYDPAALAAKLTEKSAEGWSVVSIVPTGGDITAFLTREGGAVEAAAPAAVEAPVVEAAAAAPAFVPEPVAGPEPVAAAPAPAAEPAGWAVAPEPAAPAAFAPIAEPAPAYNPAPAYTPAPAAAAAPAVAAGWYADPAGRFELRYWDGGTWTEHVSRAGQQFTDPPVA
jgi:hypothetical protein